MVDSVGYVNAVAGAPSYNGRMLRQLNAVGFAGATAARPLGARSGVRPGTSATTVTATSTTWTCQPFAGLLDGQAAGEAGPYAFAFDAVATGPIDAASASIARVDIVYVQVDDPSESDGSTVPAVTRKYLAGTVASTPPATPARSIVIAHINVPISGGGSPTVTWKAPYCAVAGGVVDFNTKAELDLWLMAALWQKARVLATGTEYVWDGTEWALSGGGLVLLDAVTFTGAASASVDGLTGYDRYRVVVSVPTTSTALNLSVRLRSGGADNSSAVYDAQSISAAATTVTGVEAVAQTSWANLTVGARSIHSMEIELDGLSLAQQTVADIRVRSANASANLGQMATAARHRTGSAFDGLSVIASTGTMTGTIKVYGYA